MSDLKREKVPYCVKVRTIELLDNKLKATMPDGREVEVKLTAAEAIAQACKENGVEVRPGWKTIAGSFVFSWRKSLENSNNKSALTAARQAAIQQSAAATQPAVHTNPKLDDDKVVATTSSYAPSPDLAAQFAAKLEASKKEKGDMGKGKGGKKSCDSAETEATAS